MSSNPNKSLQIHVVDETRQYSCWTDDESLIDGIKFVGLKTGIIAAKRALNDLHYTLGQQKFSQVHFNNNI